MNYDYILYKYSPFLPLITEGSMLRTLSNAYDGIHPAVAIAFETCAVGVTQNSLIESELPWIKKQFWGEIDLYDINQFLLGFVTPPTLIAGANLIYSHGQEKAFEMICPPSEDPQVALYNKYLEETVTKAYRLFSLVSLNPVDSARPIYDLSKLVVYSDTYWYLAGLEASDIIYFQFSWLFDPSI